MKRVLALQPLSHQHHNTLTACLLIKKGIQKKADKKVLRDFTMKLWNDDVRHHMQAEEQFVSPHLKKVNAQYDSLVKRDHETLRLLAERIKVSENGYTVYNVFASLLEQHVRFEERVVFNKMQEHLSEPELSQLGASLNGLSGKKCTDYPVKFWE
jgi:hypothetical protein